MFNSGYKGIRAVDGSGIVTLKDVEVQQTSLQPKITSWSYTNGAYVPYPDTAIVGGETIVIYGSGFQNGANVYIGSTAITSTRLDQNRITFTAPSQSAGSYVLYVINPNGNAAVYAPGIYYNSYPVWNTTVYANTFTAPTSSVSFNLNATDSANLTFTLQSGSLPTGLTLYPSGLISGTTTVANTTVYTFTAVATDSFNQAAQASIIYTITYIISDPYFNQTALLLNGETNTNTYIQDTSNNNFALTVSGAANPNRFSPLWGNGYYGNYFDGSTGYLQSPLTNIPTSLWYGTAFTLEYWIYPLAFGGTVNSSNYSNVIGWGDPGTSNEAFGFGPNSSGTIIMYYYNGSPIYYATSATIPKNAWTHLALDGNNGVMTIYVNGVSVGSTTKTGTPQGGDYFLLGAMTNTGRFNGYLSNVRVTNTRQYTNNFIPSQSPLTAVTGTQLLTCQSNSFIDNSINNNALTQAGTVKVVPNQPFATVPSTATITTNNAGYYSAQFDGSTGYLTAPSNTAFNFGSGAFTIEFWAYLTAFPTNNNAVNIFQMGNHTGGGNFLEVGFINYSGTTTFVYNLYNTAYKVQISTNFSTLNTWTHFAVIFTGTTVYTSINGVLSAGTSYNGSDAPTGQTVFIGYELSSPTTYFSGFISNLRVLKGTALYTTNFTPSTTPLTAIANTSLLTLQNSMIVDNSTNAFTITPSGKVIVSQNQPFASPTTSNTAITPSVYGSSLFDGSSSYLALGGQSAFAFGTGNFTIECWIYTTTASSTQNFYSSINGSYITAPDIYIQSSKFWVQVSGSNPINGSGPTTVISNTWYHVALVKNGSTTTLYVNGVYEASFSDSNTYVIGANRPVIGIYGYNGSSYPFSGYISNMRVVKGTAVYTSNFTPPTTPPTAIANTSLLTLQNKNGANNNTFYDDSTNNFPITRTGTPTQGTFSPFSQTGWSIAYPALAYMTYSANPIGTFGAGATFTVEAWVNMSTYSANTYFFTLLSSCDQGTVLNWAIGINSTGLATVYWWDGSATHSCAGSTALAKGTWYHVAANVTAGVVKIYINGAAETLTGPTTLTNPTSVNSNYTTGCERGSNNGGSSGYISNLRTNTGALYPSAFTPSTTPLTNVANTTLLTAQSNRFVDNSSSARAITPFATTPPSVQAFSPFAPGVSYSSANNGGSMYFPAINNYLYTTNNIFNVSSGTLQWTFETWVYPTNTNNYFFGIGSGGAYGNSMFCGWSSNNFNFGQGNGGGSNPVSVVSTSGTYYPYAWYHYAVSKDYLGNIRLFINGVQVNTQNYTSTVASGTTAVINGVYDNGGLGNYGGQWYLSGLRLVIGQTLYTSAFTPPTAPLTPTANTTLLLLGTNTGVQDATGKNNIITYGSAMTQSNTVKYGTGAMQFSSTNYLTLLATPLVSAFGSGSFTVEAWIYPTQSGTFTLASSNYNYSSATGNWSFYFSPGSASLLYFNTTSVNHASSTTTTISLNTWTHIAYSRNGSTAYFFVNGTQVGTTVSDTTNYPSGGLLYIGQQNDGTGSATGYIDDLRITNGIARYTANFTPPTVPDLTQ
jgi:hypothetical protein